MQFATGEIPHLSHISLFSLINIAFEAGEAIMDIYADYCANADAAEVQQKTDDSPLTKADIASHLAITRALGELTPHVPVVSEEGNMPPTPHTSPYWLIDPLDGTKEFLKHSGEFTVNIALIHEGFPTFGIVYAPALDECYIGGEGVGAYHYHNEKWTEITAPLALAPRLRVIASKSHLCAKTEAFIAALGECDMVQAGSSLKFCRIAMGDADIYPRMGPTCEWDTAAAQAIVEAMGGTVCDLAGNRLSYGKDSILNPPFVVTSHLLKDRYVKAG